MIEVRADVAKNYLYLRLEGILKSDELRMAGDKVIEEVKKLSPGFSVINDISKFKPADEKGTEEIKRTQEYVAKKEVKKYIRITGSSVSKMQFQRTSAEVGYKAVEVANMEEALKQI
jgi:hypothetical protein